MPRLSYRTLPLKDEPDTETNTTNATVPVPPSTVKPRPRPSRPSSTNPAASLADTRTSVADTSPIARSSTKKKGSLFAGLFVKEPSSAALEQLAQKLIAEHGELSARAIPGVSCATMPKTVPKVNSKWDGRPGATRPRRSRGLESRGTKSASSASSARSHSADPLDRDYAPSRGNHREPWQFSSSSSVDRQGPPNQYSPPATSASVITTHSGVKGFMSANAPGEMPRPHSACSRTLRSPSGSSLPPITSYFPDPIPDPPRRLSKFRTHDDAHATLPTRSKPVGLSKSRPQISIAPGTPALSDSMSSRSGASSEASLATPLSTCYPVRSVDQALSVGDDPILASFVQPMHDKVVLLSSGKNVLGPPVGPHRKVKPSAQAFPAGEACPLEIPDDSMQDSQHRHGHKGRPSSGSPMLSRIARVQQDLERRPDSSRARLGLRASMLVDADTLPWQSQEDTSHGSRVVHGTAPSTLTMPTSPKLKSKGFAVFGRDRAER